MRVLYQMYLLRFPAQIGKARNPVQKRLGSQKGLRPRIGSRRSPSIGGKSETAREMIPTIASCVYSFFRQNRAPHPVDVGMVFGLFQSVLSISERLSIRWITERYMLKLMQHGILSWNLYGTQKLLFFGTDV